LSNRYQGDIQIVEKLDTHKIFTAVYFDGEQNCFYIKRFAFEPNDNIVTSFISDSPGSYLHELTTDKYPQLEIKFDGKHSKRASEIIDVSEFIAGKSYRAKGKRLTTFEIGTIKFIEPLEKETEFNGNGIEFELVVENGDLASEPENGDNSENITPDSDKDISPTLF